MARFINSFIVHFSAKRFFEHRLLSWAVLILAFTQFAVGQTVIIHLTSTYSEDGDPKYDADGEKNNVVVWKGGVVHVIDGGYFVAPVYPIAQYTLKIEPDAIVKIASHVYYINDQWVWLPPSWGDQCGFSAYINPMDPTGQFNGVIQIDRAIITDIRDDDVGGDTNQDGSSSLPPNPSDMGIGLEFSGTGKDYIKNSTLKYVRFIRPVGSMEIKNNNFFMFGQLLNFYSTSCPPQTSLGATPIIEGNTFEFASNRAGKSGLQLQGTSPSIQGNIFRYAQDAEKGYNPNDYDPIIIIGLSFAETCSGISYPSSGTTFIDGNFFQTGGGIQVQGDLDYVQGKYISGLTKTIFQANIQDNRFEAPSTLVGGKGGRCLILPIAAKVQVTKNNIINYETPILFDTLGQANTQSLLEIMGNRFEQCRWMLPLNYYAFSSYWSKGTFINARNNYWGDPSGPYDNSDIDGLSNPRGKGITIPNGIDYIPFVGGLQPAQDAIHIISSSNSSSPLIPKANVDISISVDRFQLKSSNTGKIIVYIRDKDGIILNTQDAGINVSSQSSSADIPIIQITVPELSNIVTVEAVLAPDGGGETVISNIVPFRVEVPPSAFTITNIIDADTRKRPEPIRGNKLKLKVYFQYTYPASNVNLELAVKERIPGNGTVLTEFPSASFSYSSGTNIPDSAIIDLDIPLRDVELYPKTDLYCQITMKTENGSEIGKDGIGYIIDHGGSVRIELLVPIGVDINSGKGYPLGRNYYKVGEYPGYPVRFGYNIKTINVSNWLIWFNEEALDANGNLLYRYTALGPTISNASTGSQTGIVKSMGATTPIPAETKKIRVYMRLKTPEDINVANTTYDIEVRDQPAQSTPKSVVVGGSQVAFNPIPVTLNFTSNQYAGTAFADEFEGQYSTVSSIGKLNKMMKTNNLWYWEFIPLNKYWSVYDTLKEGTFSATISFIYNPAADFPNVPGFNEDSLVITGLNPLSGELEVLPSTLNKSTHTITTEYSKFFDTWVVASKATVFVTRVLSDLNVIPERFVLEQNFPNPFNNSSVIKYSIPNSSKVIIKVFDVLGNEIETLVNEEKATGNFEVTWYAENVPSGVYFYQLEAGNFIDTKKMLLLK